MGKNISLFFHSCSLWSVALYPAITRKVQGVNSLLHHDDLKVPAVSWDDLHANRFLYAEFPQEFDMILRLYCSGHLQINESYEKETTKTEACGQSSERVEAAMPKYNVIVYGIMDWIR